MHVRAFDSTYTHRGTVTEGNTHIYTLYFPGHKVHQDFRGKFSGQNF